MSADRVRMTRAAKPISTAPSSGKTVTVTVTLPVQSAARYTEEGADFINEAAREFARRLGPDFDQNRVKVEISYDYPQWKRVYEPDSSP